MGDIRIVSREDIDLQRWDALCLKKSGVSLYQQSWFLDAMTEKSWSALVMDDYVAVLPFYKKRKWLIPYILPPLLCQRLGVVGSANDKERRLLYEWLSKQAIKVMISSDDPVPEGFTVTKRINHILPLKDAYVTVRQRYNRNTRRNLEDFTRSGQKIETSVDIIQICQFIAVHDPTGLIARYRGSFEKLMREATDKGCGFVLTAKWEHTMVSAAFYIVWNQRIYFLLCGSDTVGKESQATYAIIDAIIKKYAGTGFVFDFTGSGIPGVARRNEGFGAQTEEYWHADLFLKNNFIKLILQMG
jgi:hypothetical protein